MKFAIKFEEASANVIMCLNIILNKTCEFFKAKKFKNSSTFFKIMRKLDFAENTRKTRFKN